MADIIRFPGEPEKPYHTMVFEISRYMHGKMVETSQRLVALKQVDSAELGWVVRYGIRLLWWYTRYVAAGWELQLVRRSDGMIKPVKINFKTGEGLD